VARGGLWPSVLGALLGNYRVVQQLSEGGMGVVYLGQHEALASRVVIKVLQPELCDDADMVQRFFNEARAATAIRSPGIVQVFDFGVTPDQRAYCVMELLEGESLAVRLKRRRFDFAECCRLGRQLANVLHAAHAAGIIHRDLKPANLFLVPDPEVAGGERVKVLDFGIAKLAGEAHGAGVRTGTGLMMGTPYYMSPEQCRSASAADARSDIYSLGCILFEIACGRPPFLFTGVADIVTAHLHEPPPHSHQLAPGVPLGLSALISQMLAKHPDARPQTMAAVGQALDDLLRTADPGAGRIPTPLPGAVPAFARPGTLPAHLMAPAATPGIPPPGMPPTAQPMLLAIAQPGPMAIAEPVRLPRPPVPAFSSITTTLRRLRGSFGSRRGRIRRLTYLLGALVIAGAITAIAIVLSSERSGPEEPRVSYAKIAGASRASGAPAADPPAGIVDVAVTGAGSSATTPERATDAAGASPAVPAAPSILADAATANASVVDSVTSECRRYDAERSWQALAQCAVKLRPLDAKLAEELSTRAAEETRSAPHVAAARDALRDRALKRAKAEIDQVWPGSVDCADLQHAYAAAEAQQIDALATELDSVKDASCAAYNQLLAKYRASDPPHVAQEAARRVPCNALPRCDADALEAQARALFNKNKYEDALDAYDQAYACRPDPALLRDAFVVACNMRHKFEARSYWRQLSRALQIESLGVCVRNGITEAMLNAP
jgi:tRNA A-37 threonylcarbamoyl transferase component Bud32